LTAKKDIKTTPERSRIMSSVKQKGTGPEKAVWRIAKKLDVDFETNQKDLPGRPDLVNKKDKWAIFIHGCFWHAHKGCNKWTIPKTNTDFWVDKFKENTERDKRKKAELEKLGYEVTTIWQCETENEDYVKDVLSKLGRLGILEVGN